ncbi:MAG: hypothetical protein RBS35_00125 [Azonexus sp.]|jgi:hypothetical protein|nr:hypothetical protein [Azonexus sp.]
MIEANQKLFARLADAVGDLVSSQVLQQKRAVQTDRDGKRWLQHLDIRSSSHLLLSSTSSLALGEYEGDHYLVAVGLEVTTPPAEFECIPVNSGMFTAIVSELQVPLLRSMDLAQQLHEYVFYPLEGEVGLIDVEIVRRFFESIDVFRIDPTSGLVFDREFGLRAAIAAILGAPKARPLEWPATSLERLSYMIRDPDEQAPFHLLLRAITETREDSAFLAIYRCVEQLFPIPAIAELSDALGLSHPALQVAATIEQHLGWRRREDDAIAHLFGELEAPLIDRLLQIVGVVPGEENRSKPVAKRIYELRNQCVHYRPVHGTTNGKQQFNSWLALSDILLEVIQHLYSRYSGAFARPQNAVAV